MGVCVGCAAFSCGQHRAMDVYVSFVEVGRVDFDFFWGHSQILGLSDFQVFGLSD